MSEFNQTQTYVNETGTTLNAYITKVFSMMGIAVLLTAAIAFVGYLSLVNGGFLYNLYTTPPISAGSSTVNLMSIAYIVCAIAQFGVCIFLSMRITKMETKTAQILFYAYAALTGVTFAVLPMAFDVATVFSAFAFAAVMFFCCAIIGHTTNVDLTKFSGLLIGGLIALVVATILSLFVPVLRDSLIISYIGVLLFLVITAWDMQKIKQFYYGTQGGMGTLGGNLAVYGAFQLYLDFINLFLRILRILGSRSNRN